MVASNIKVCIRIRPCARPSKGFVADTNGGVLNFDLEKRSADGQVDNSKTHFKFKFDSILPMQVTQNDVFEAVAKPVIDDVLQGINGTIFAYGQTGSGKTFTITGGAERYEDRGLIPRTITYLFDAFKRNSDHKYSLYISYLEIYNNDGFDLLSRDDAAKLEDLPKVILREDEEGNIKLRNLSVNMAQKEEDALNLLFLGDTNRVVAETPMNDASTRSHCMFIMWVESSQVGSDTVRRAKLHLVDLAGSERIGKTGVEGKLRTEATCINLSLHYLEQVIVALHDRAQGRRQHVPYRNSILTSVLRDSLGGNCKTVMVGAIAVEDTNVEESISTCRFAQRVASIKNNAVINEELDPALLIRRLKKEVAQLKDELAMLSGGQDASEELPEADMEELNKLVLAYVEDVDADAPFVCGSVHRFRTSFNLLRQLFWDCDNQNAASGLAKAGNLSCPRTSSGNPGSQLLGTLESAVLELRQQKARRDEEVGMLLSSINKRSAKGRSEHGEVPIVAKIVQGLSDPSSGTHTVSQREVANDTALLLDRNKAFEVFRKSVRRRQGLQESHDHQNKLVDEARACGEAANAARGAINSRKARIERLRMECAFANSPSDLGTQAGHHDGSELAALLEEVEEQKRIYHQNTERLRQVKLQIDSYKKSKQQSEDRMRKDFESWYKAVCASQGVQVAFAESVGEEGLIDNPVVVQHPGPPEHLASVCSTRSEADSSARATPIAAARLPSTNVDIALGRASDEAPPLQMARAWEPADAREAASPTEHIEVAGSQVLVIDSAGKLPNTVEMTGDQQTDESIMAYYAALAALNG